MIAPNTLTPPSPPSISGTTIQLRPVYGVGRMQSLSKVESPKSARIFAKMLMVIFVITVIGLFFLPWQQTVNGRGQVIAYKPTERQQAISAPISGLVLTWHVVEGTRVKAGDPIVDLMDPDPNFEARLNNQKTFLEGRKKQFEEQIIRRTKVINELKSSLDAQIKVADQSVLIAQQTIEQRKRLVGTTKERFELAEKEFSIFRKANESGLRPEIDVIRQMTTVNVAKLEAERAVVDLTASQEALTQSMAIIPRIKADATGAINTSEQELERLTGEKFSVERELQQIETQMSRYAARFVKAPVDGTVFRIEENGGQGGGQVKEGTNLAVIVPDSENYVVELFIDGVDAPLIQREEDGRYPHVRLQFEGWPAVQFTGWPSAAYGTFGGRVKQIDQTDNGKGQFRVLIEPDPIWDHDDWPSQEFLRQGNQAVGWVFLQRVTLGWELWRRLNGFPPVVAPAEPKKSKEQKPAKIKLP